MLNKLQINSNVTLADKTSWQVGGPAEFYCAPDSIEQLKECLKWANERNHKITILSGGSNVLVSDAGIKGLVIGMGNLNHYESEVINNRFVIKAQAGVGKSEILKLFLKHKLAPALFLAGLPGDVGAGVVMNAGVSEKIVPQEFGEIVDNFEVLKWKSKTNEFTTQKFNHKDIKWNYRHTYNWQPGIITSVTMSWPLEPQMQILDEVRAANKNRLLKQPLELPSCGSVFVNPEGHKAAQLIDKCGLKGFTIGGAQVSLKHANFIVNIGKAKAKEIDAVIQHVKKEVKANTGVSLHTEVIYLGEW